VIELFIAMLILPAAVIAVWEVLMRRLSPNARKVTRLTGFIGVPVHELSHALVCILFGMRITRIAFFQPNSATGTLGYVEYRFSPYSIRHAFGQALQGIAPLLAGAVIVGLLLGNWWMFEVPGVGIKPMAIWIGDVAAGTLDTAWTQVKSGPVGAGAVLLAMVISMHAIPSLADIKGGLRGLIVLLGASAVVAVAADMIWAYELDLGEAVGSIVHTSVLWLEAALWGGLFGAVCLVTMTMLSGLVLILVPTLCLFVVDFVRGARGRI